MLLVKFGAGQEVSFCRGDGNDLRHVFCDARIRSSCFAFAAAVFASAAAICSFELGFDELLQESESAVAKSATDNIPMRRMNLLLQQNDDDDRVTRIGPLTGSPQIPLTY